MEEEGAAIIEAHQELAARAERGASKVRALSAVTVVVSAILAGAYSLQLALPLFGTRTVVVDLADPGAQAAELLVLALALLWLYVGARDLRFSTRIGKEIRDARRKEREIRERIPA